ncbi:MAG: YebC/PmpR family DNA-binding transcriptional regulator [Desulfurellaceae bacterium]|jgi:YebC/PmpR family DNA-binding regulatory protein|nr:YebC/PmpR family DNA-binding transcriptional regulator [Desulfurellaceae bacterium]
MSGHSKWSSIKHKKGRADAKRGQIFTKLIKEVTIATRLGGKDINANPRLRLAVEKSKESNMPKENIERAIKKGAGELPGVSYEEVLYEGYGPGGVAILIYATTDNKKRTTSNIRHILSKYGGNLGENGCVSWMFERRGCLTFSREKTDEEQLMEKAIEAGATDVIDNGEDGVYEVIVETKVSNEVKDSLIQAGFNPQADTIEMIPQSTVKLEGKDAERMLNLMNKLDEDEDVSQVYANFDISNEIMEKFQ